MTRAIKYRSKILICKLKRGGLVELICNQQASEKGQEEGSHVYIQYFPLNIAVKCLILSAFDNEVYLFSTLNYAKPVY